MDKIVGGARKDEQLVLRDHCSISRDSTVPDTTRVRERRNESDSFTLHTHTRNRIGHQ